jgi:N-hydroxyarylamine O-acetyltransferase
MPFDLEAYFVRIEYSGGRSPTLETLKGLHLAHATHIPFENLDVLLGRPIGLDLESIEAKLVRGRRGGYCFEQNLLFAAVLERLGFGVTLLQARVRLGAQRVLPRTHVLLAVDVAGDRWLADLGFGSFGLVEPLPLETGEFRQFAWKYRLMCEPDVWVLQAPVGGIWQDLYTFTQEPQLPVDFEPANHYVSTHPDSRFVQTLTAQRVAPDVRMVLKNTELVVTTAAGDARRTLANSAELLEVLATEFGLQFPAGTEFLPASLFRQAAR